MVEVEDQECYSDSTIHTRKFRVKDVRPARRSALEELASAVNRRGQAVRPNTAGPVQCDGATGFRQPQLPSPRLTGQRARKQTSLKQLLRRAASGPRSDRRSPNEHCRSLTANDGQ